MERKNKQTKELELKKLMEPLLNGQSMGVVSESGCPGVADPGALAVKFAHQHNIQVVPLVGPSSILLALMASGMNGQCFAFQGYLSRQCTNFHSDISGYIQTKQHPFLPYSVSSSKKL